MAGASESAGTVREGLNSELAGYAAQFEAARTGVHALVEGLSDELFNKRYTEESWSIAECLDHLCVIGAALVPYIDRGIEKGKNSGWESPGPFQYGRLGNWFISMSGPSPKARKRKFKTPKMYTPSSNHTVSRLVTTFVDLQGQFLERVEGANGLDLARIKISSPVTRLLRFSLGQWFTLVTGHQERHFLQAQEVRAEVEPGKGPA